MLLDRSGAPLFGRRVRKHGRRSGKGSERMNGLWVAHFNAGPAHGNGLAVFRAGEILGGDLAHTWTGTYQEEGNRLYARIRVSPYVSKQNGEPVVPELPVMLTLSGVCGEHDAVLNGHADQSDVAVSIEMHKRA